MRKKPNNLFKTLGAFVEMKKSTRRKKAGWVIVSFLVLFFFLFLFSGEDGFVQMIRLKRQKTELSETRKKLEKEKETLKQDIHELQNDVEAVERIARGKYGMARPGEKVIKFVPPANAE